MEAPMELKPIANFYCDKIHPQDAAKQASIDSGHSIGEIRFFENFNFEQCLEDLDGFSHLWIIYFFHQNHSWKAKVLPPRGSDIKRGVFSTRSPYRPNPLGLSCVEIERVAGLSLFVKSFDLLHETPILDVKPYLPYADSFPEAKVGWLEGLDADQFSLYFSDLCLEQLRFLETAQVRGLKSFIHNHLTFEPLNKKKKRLRDIQADRATLCYRTWRILFSLDFKLKTVFVQKIISGYSDLELNDIEDSYSDKEIHRAFRKIYDSTRLFAR